MATQQTLMEVAGVEPGVAVAGPAPVARLKEPDRKQMVIGLLDLRCVSTTLRQPAREFSDFSPLS